MWYNFFNLGLDHILSFNGLDHALFVVGIALGYEPKFWRQLLIMITAFTLGHSITLALSALSIINLPSEIIEPLVPLTIMMVSGSALYYNIKQGPDNPNPVFRKWQYVLMVAFGLIHGMAFSYYLKTLLDGIDTTTFIVSLLSFNVGLEAGQVIIVSCVLVLMVLLDYIFKRSKTQSRFLIIVACQVIVFLSSTIFLIATLK